MTISLILKNALNKSITYTHPNEDLTIDELYQIIMGRFTYTSNKQFNISCNGITMSYDESTKNQKFKQNFKVNSVIATIYIMVVLPGGYVFGNI